MGNITSSVAVALSEFNSNWDSDRLAALFAENKELNTECKVRHALQFKFGTIIPKPETKVDDSLIETWKKYTIVHPDDIMINGLNLNYDFVTFRIGLVKEDGIITSAYISLRPREGVNAKFYNYYFKALDARKVFHGLGTGIRLTLSYKELKNVILPIPPREEQDQIVRYLDWKISEVNRLIAIKKKELKCIEELKKTIARDAVTGKDKKSLKDSGNNFVGEIPETWEMWPIKRYFNIYTGATPKSGNPDFWNGNICWLTPADYKTYDKYVSSGRKSITEEGYRSCGTTLVPAGSLIFSKRAPVGTVAISKNEVCTSQGCLSCVPKTGDDIEYLYYVFACLSEMFDVVSVGATFKEIATVVFSNLKIPHPPIEEQHEIVNSLNRRFSELNNLINVKKNQIEDLEDLKAKIISDAVTGKIDVREIEIPEYEYIEDEFEEDVETDSDDDEIGEQED